MLTNKEVFNYLEEIRPTLESKACMIAREKHLDREDVKSTMYLASFKMFKRNFNPKKSKPITFFLNFCVGVSKKEIIRDSYLIKLPHNKIEKGLYKDISYTSLDIKTGEDGDNDLYDLYAFSEDKNVKEFDLKNYIDSLVNNPKLTTKESYIVKSIYGIGCERKNKNQLANEYNCSEANIYLIKSRAINKIKQFVEQ